MVLMGTRDQDAGPAALYSYRGNFNVQYLQGFQFVDG
jgi:hypothetical protein